LHALSPQDWAGTENTGFQGKIDHSKKRPFKDGWTAASDAPPPQRPVSTVDEQQLDQIRSNPEVSKTRPPAVSSALPGADDPGVVQGTAVRSHNILPFMAEAVQQVVAHNFTGDSTEPDHWKAPDKEKHAAGWSGDIHTRGKDG
jgi:hypothetical protein